jgi:hypothetical protein
MEHFRGAPEQTPSFFLQYFMITLTITENQKPSYSDHLLSSGTVRRKQQDPTSHRPAFSLQWQLWFWKFAFRTILAWNTDSGLRVRRKLGRKTDRI